MTDVSHQLDTHQKVLSIKQQIQYYASVRTNTLTVNVCYYLAMQKTTPVAWIKEPYEGYVLNTPFSDQNADLIMSLIDKIKSEYDTSVYCTGRDSLHITLLDWIAPLVDYGSQDKAKLFNQIYDQYDATIEAITANMHKFEVTFDTIQVSPSTVYISGHDNGEFAQIRNRFLETTELLPDTKLPPTIIHSSLARFTDEIDFSKVESFVSKLSIDFKQTINNFRLVHSHREPMLEFEVIKNYSLSGPSIS